MNYNVSVIIPFYNVENYLDRCVTSLMNQTCQELQYIFVNDGSTDNGLNVLDNIINKKFPHKLDDIVIIDVKDNLGSANARNEGLRYVKGEYIGWVDGDDWIELNTFEEMYNFAKTNKLQIVYCDYYLHLNGSIQRMVQQELSDKIELIDAMLPGYVKGSLCNKLIHRSLYENQDVHFIEGADMGEDMQILIKLFYYCDNFSYMPASFYHYEKNAYSISETLFSKNKLNVGWIQNISEVDRFLKKHNVQGVENGLTKLKVGSKNHLLIKGKSISDYLLWRNTFPEVNNYSYTYGKNPLYYRILSYCIDRNIWFFPKLWLTLRKFI